MVHGAGSGRETTGQFLALVLADLDGVDAHDGHEDILAADRPLTSTPAPRVGSGTEASRAGSVIRPEQSG